MKVTHHNPHPVEQYVIDKVTTFRKEKNLTARQLAAIIHTGGSFVCNVESLNNSAKYNLKHIYYIAKYFKVSPKYFLPDIA